MRAQCARATNGHEHTLRTPNPTALDGGAPRQGFPEAFHQVDTPEIHREFGEAMDCSIIMIIPSLGEDLTHLDLVLPPGLSITTLRRDQSAQLRIPTLELTSPIGTRKTPATQYIWDGTELSGLLGSSVCTLRRSRPRQNTQVINHPTEPIPTQFSAQDTSNRYLSQVVGAVGSVLN